MIIFASDSPYTYILLNKFVKTYCEEITSIYISKSLRRQKMHKFFIKKIIKGLGFQYYVQRIFYTIKSRHANNSIVKLAMEYKIPVIHTSNINDINILSKIRGEKPDIVIAAYFDQIIKKDMLKIPSFGILNIHMSMLPKYRGVKPVFWVLKNNESKTGITIHLMDEGLDTGDILAQEEVEISPEDSVDSLSKKISYAGSTLLVDTVESIFRDNYRLHEQNFSLSSYYSQPSRKDVKYFYRQGKKFY